jgi:hypothetical protein
LAVRGCPAILCLALVAGAVPETGGAQTTERVSTLADQQQVGVTIYNAGLALVHDRRHVGLGGGLNHLAWRDVSANMDPTTALVESETAPGGVSVLEQNFNFDLLKPSTLLEKYVGRDVTVVHDKKIPGEPDRETARILSTNDGIVLKYADRIETQVEGHIVFPSIPDNLRDRPTLVLELNSRLDRAQDLDLSYLTAGIGWSADYVGLVAPGDDKLDLNGLVTLSNTSGTTYRNARLQLVAGNVNVTQPPSPKAMQAIGRVTAASAADGFRQENFGDYHLYTLQRPTTIADNQTKQVALLSAHAVPLRKTYELRGSGEYYTSEQSDLGDRIPVGVYFTFENKGGELGVPLPGGIVRLYKRDTSGASQFLGSDRIDHTPRNERVRLHVGDAFDVTARKRQTDFRTVGNPPRQQYDSSYEIVLRNAKEAPVDVLVIESLPGEWQIVSESAKHVKSSSTTATWTIRVPAGGQTSLTYTARTRY